MNRLSAARKLALVEIKDEFAEASPQPPLDKLYDYTYADGAVTAGVSPAQSKESVADTVTTAG